MGSSSAAAPSMPASTGDDEPSEAAAMGEGAPDAAAAGGTAAADCGRKPAAAPPATSVSSELSPDRSESAAAQAPLSSSALAIANGARSRSAQQTGGTSGIGARHCRCRYAVVAFLPCKAGGPRKIARRERIEDRVARAAAMVPQCAAFSPAFRVEGTRTSRVNTPRPSSPFRPRPCLGPGATRPAATVHATVKRSR